MDRTGIVVQQFQVSLERAAGEGVLHDTAMMTVLVEVEEHEAAMEERADNRRPPAGARQRLVLVDPCAFQRFGAHQQDDAESDTAGPRDGSVPVVATAREVERINH
jgi:predicted kinase